MHAAQGCLELLDRSGVQIAGRNAAVIGRSNIVGAPAAMLLQVLADSRWICLASAWLLER